MSLPPSSERRATGERRVDATHAALREAILGGELRPGQPLSVPELARRLGVSRSPVREAVLRLAAEGLAQEEARRGAVVALLGPAEALHLLEVREALETAAARRSARSASPAGLAELRRCWEEQAGAAGRADEAGYRAAGLSFHRQLGALGGNPVLAREVGLLVNQSALALGPLARDPRLWEGELADRRRVLEALEARDGGRAAAALGGHFARLREVVEPHLAGPGAAAVALGSRRGPAGRRRRAFSLPGPGLLAAPLEGKTGPGR